MGTWTAVNVEVASVASSTIDTEWVSDRNVVVIIPWIRAAGADAVDATPFDSLRAWGAISVEHAGERGSRVEAKSVILAGEFFAMLDENEPSLCQDGE